MTKPLPPEKRKRRFDIVDWNEARLELLRTMFADRRSASEIAYAVQGGATRNAVLGKMHRLGLVRRSAKEIHRLSTAKTELAAFERKRAQAERQRVVSGRAVVAKREPRRFADTDGLVKELKQRQKAEHKAARPWRDKLHDLSPQALAERREKQAAAGRAAIAKVELKLIDNPAFVAKAEKPFDPYAHLRTERGYHDAIAALSR